MDQQQMSERLMQQMKIDETYVEPVWSANVDMPLLNISLSRIPAQPVILLPELRLKSLLRTIAASLASGGKLMIVDESNTRFEVLRQFARECRVRNFFSTQKLSALNYEDNIFHLVLTEPGLGTISHAEIVFPAYYRVLKPGGRLVFSAPLLGSFPAFFDLLEESILTVYPMGAQEIMETVYMNMDLDNMYAVLQSCGFYVESSDIMNFEIRFNDVAQQLFSTLVETQFLGYFQSFVRPDIDMRALLTRLVRSFHSYFEGTAIQMPMKIALISACKPG
ncbi:MAG: methyltransferase domain-containing protein [Proteobacteria bacterium]|nr:methyltransferase domain-containing protein [Pseudomonadota bacterium]